MTRYSDYKEQRKKQNQTYIKNFKDGIADALFNGNMAEEYSDGYKAGYDFGLTLFNRLESNND